jgi:hypothetical protein
MKANAKLHNAINLIKNTKSWYHVSPTILHLSFKVFNKQSDRHK